MIFKRVDVTKASYKVYPYKSHSSSFFVTQATYTKIADMFAERLAYYMIVTGRPIRLPANYGFLQAVKYIPPTRRKFVDFKLTKAIKTMNPEARSVGYTNMKTNGTWARVHWYKSQKRGYANTATFLGDYGFEICRFTRRKSSWIMSPTFKPPKVTLAEFFKDKGWKFYAQTPLLYSKSRMNAIKLLNIY